MLALAATPPAALSSDGPGDTPTPEAGAGAAKPGAEAGRSLSLAEILTATEALDASEREIRQRLADGLRIDALASEITAAQEAFSKVGRNLADVPADLMELFELTDLEVAIRTIDQRLAAATGALAGKAKALDADLDRLAGYDKESAVWLQTAQARNAPPAVLGRIQAIPRRSAALAQQLQTHRDRVLEMLSRAAQLNGAVSGVRAEIDDRREQVIARMRTARAEPIWRIEPRPGEMSRVVAFVRAQVGRGVRHVRDNAALLLAITIAAVALSHRLIVATHEQLALDPYARQAADLFRAPMVASLVVSLLTLIWLGPPGPVIYYDLLWTLLPIPAALLARAVLGSQVSLALYTLAGVIVSIALIGPLVDPLPLVGRLVLIAQCVAVATALGVDLRRGHLEQAFPGLSPALVRWVAGGMVALLALAAAASITGYLGASRVLRNAVLGSLGFTLVLTVVVHLLYGLTLALMQTRAARSLRIVRLHPGAVRRGVRTALVTVAVLVWIAAMLAASGLGDEAVQFAQGLVGAEIQIGSMHISSAGVLLGLAVLLGTYVVVKVVRLVLEVEILPRLKLEPGVPFAVSAVIRYGLVTAGMLLAMAAMGVDLTEVTLLAGALGVGIGLGLQGVVNSFVSGLILLVERPVKVGDAVQMGELSGEVRRIGVRSSTIRTSQGAEVIVPNADLIAKEVTNWTLSDRKRRLEIDISVAYGTEPEQVVRLLEAVAKEVEDVVASPAPSAWLTGFGESSLNFRLHAWIDDCDRGLASQSALGIAIMRKFKEAGISLGPTSGADLPGAGEAG